MAKPSRKEILAEMESVRDGLWQAHMAFAEHKDKIAMGCMRAHHKGLNRMIARMGGESVELPDLESMVQQLH